MFDAGLGESSIGWTLVQPLVAKFARTCVYDRAGFAWSERGPLPRTAGRAADELRVALDRAGERPPFLLVGHSFGGMIARIFANRYRCDTAGLVLVDPAAPEEWAAPTPAAQALIERGVRLCRIGVLLSWLGVARLITTLLVAGAVKPARWLADAFTRGGIGSDAEWMLATLSKLPPEARRVLPLVWREAKYFEALGSQIRHVSASARETFQADADGYQDLPLVTLSSSNPTPDRVREQEALARLSTRGRHLVAAGSGHWILLDEPAWVASVIRQVHQSAVTTHPE